MKYFITAPNRTDLYWRSKRCGYTTNLAQAGLYEESEAKGIESGGRGDKAIRFVDKYMELVELRKERQKDLWALDEMLGNSTD